MTAFGQSHRQLVENTNEGIVEPTSSEKATSTAQVGGRQTQQLGPDHALATALVDVAGTVAQPAIAEANRKKELQGYEDAGEEEGKKAADSAADVWHNKLFGADASLRGAQERIAEDNSRRIYLKGQDLLENGGADSWTDKEWKDWKDKELSDEIGKYDSQGMKDLVTTSMGRDFQNLERDRTWKHKQYEQAENRKSTTQQLSTLAETYKQDKGSDNVQRSEEDSQGRLQEILDLKEKSGVSDPVFSAIMAQVASDELTNGNPDFLEFGKENDLFDDLSFEDQQRLDDALDVHELQNNEEFGNRHQSIFGPTGSIARGDVNGALAAYDSLVADYPKAIPQGGRNAVRNQVRDVARSNAEHQRHEQAKLLDAKADALSGTQTPLVFTDALGRTTVTMPNEYERGVGAQAAVEEIITNDFHSDQRAGPDGATYEPRDLTSTERAQYRKKHAAKIGQIQATNGTLLPEVQALANQTAGKLDPAVLTNMSPDEAVQFKNDVDTLVSMANGSAAMTGLLVDALGDDYGKLVSTQRELSKDGITPNSHGKFLQNEAANVRSKEQTALGADSAGGGGSAKGVGGNNNDYAHTLGFWDKRGARQQVQDIAEEGGFLLWGKGNNNETIDNDLDFHYNEYMSTQANPSLKSVRENGMNYAAGKVAGQGAYVTNQDGKQFMNGIAQAEKTVQLSNFDDFDHFLKDYASNPHNIAAINDGGGLDIGPSLFGGNQVTNNISEVIDNGDGSISLIFPRDGREPYSHTVTLPDHTDPRQQPIKVQEDIARTEYGMSIINKDEELWKDLTEQRESPREKFDRKLKREILQDLSKEQVDALAEANGIKPSRSGTYRYSELEGFITPEQLEKHLPNHQYNKQLLDRQSDAVAKQVQTVRAIENLQTFEQNNKAMYGQTSIADQIRARRERTELTDIDEVSVPRYMPGESIEDTQKRLDAAVAAHKKKAAEHRQQEIENIRSNLR